MLCKVFAALVAILSGNVLAQPATWQPMGAAPGPVFDLAVHNGELYATGLLSPNGELGAAFVARWDGVQWVRLGGAIGQVRPGGLALASFAGEIYVAGNTVSTQAGGFSSVFRWDGQSWQAAGDPSGSVYDLIVYDNQLCAGGDFQTAQGFTRVRAWNGQTWTTLGPTVQRRPNFDFLAAYRLAIIDGDLYYGSNEFAVPNGVQLPALARWDGTTWNPLPSPGTGPVISIASWEGKLIVGLGARNAPSNGLWSLDGSTWRALDRFGGSNRSVGEIVPYGGELFAFGSSNADGSMQFFYGEPAISTQFTMRWCPGTRGVGEGLNNTVTASAIFNGDIVVGGYFTADGSGESMQYIARYSAGSDPTITQQPQNMPPACSPGDITPVSISAVTANRPIVYAVRESDGYVLGLSPNQAVPGTWSWRSDSSNRGLWRFVVTDTQGSTTSQPFSIPIYDIDFNNNGIYPEDQDVIDFFTSIAGGPCFTTSILGCDSIDINANGVFPEDEDVIVFFDVLAGGCP